MGFLSGLFRRSGGTDEPDNSSVEEELFECQVCAQMVPYDEFYEGSCYDCIDDSQFPKYCCGMIYEEGESSCASCGEPL